MKQAHINLDGSLAVKYALLPGDLARLDHIKKYLDNVEEIDFNREYRSLTGYYKGIKILAISTGMGGASTAIAVEELKNIGVEAMIRIGSCGALQKGINLGDLVIAEGAIRDDGASKAYVSLDYPAVANHQLVQNIISSCKEFDYPYHLGIVHSHESFYIDNNAEIEKKWSSLGVLGADFETSALFTVGRIRKVKCASILNNVVIYGEDTAESIESYSGGESLTLIGEKREILVALEAFYKMEKDI